jgi:hypothetical protein
VPHRGQAGMSEAGDFMVIEIRPAGRGAGRTQNRKLGAECWASAGEGWRNDGDGHQSPVRMRMNHGFERMPGRRPGAGADCRGRAGDQDILKAYLAREEYARRGRRTAARRSKCTSP